MTALLCFMFVAVSACSDEKDVETDDVATAAGDVQDNDVVETDGTVNDTVDAEVGATVLEDVIAADAETAVSDDAASSEADVDFVLEDSPDAQEEEELPADPTEDPDGRSSASFSPPPVP